MIALGPAVSGQHYQVGAEVIDAIAQSLDQDASTLKERRDHLERHEALHSDPTPDRFRLDIRAATTLQLNLAGIALNQISRCPLCTASEPELFHSWRRDQIKAMQWSGIVAQAISPTDQDQRIHKSPRKK